LAFIIPKAMTYATIAGLPVEVGPYTAFIPIPYDDLAVLGTSRPLSFSTTSTIAVLVGGAGKLFRMGWASFWSSPSYEECRGMSVGIGDQWTGIGDE
jgi:hypothetical protein